MRQLVVGVVGMVLAFGGLPPGEAAAVTIDFSSALPGAPAGHHTVLTNQLAGFGTLFSTTDPEGVFWLGPGYGWAPAHYSISAGGSAPIGSPSAVDPIRVDFSPYVVEASIRGFDGGGDIDTLILDAFDSDNALIDSMRIIDVFSPPGRVASVSASEIAYVTFEVSVAGSHGLFFDDLTFRHIPEPSALALLAMGTLGLLACAVRKRHC